MTRQCAVCGEQFFPGMITAKYCSTKCRVKHQNNIRKKAKQEWYLRSKGRTELLTRISKERWIHSKFGYVLIKVNGELVYEHRVLAEKALGRPLPPKAVVHHTGKPNDNHGFCKLVICPNQEYHFLLHSRMKELGYEDNLY